MLKTLIVAHTADFHTVTLLPSKESNSAVRPRNSFHFIDETEDVNSQIKSLLTQEANASDVQKITPSFSKQGVDYYLVEFTQKQNNSLTERLVA